MSNGDTRQDTTITNETVLSEYGKIENKKSKSQKLKKLKIKVKNETNKKSKDE